MTSIINRLKHGYLEQDTSLKDVLTDVTNLLNTRIISADITKFDQLNDSLLSYGLPNLSTYEKSANQTIQYLQESIKTTLNHHEPRLQDITIRAQLSSKNQIHFAIKATLMEKPEPIEINFDSIYNTANQTFES